MKADSKIINRLRSTLEGETLQGRLEQSKGTGNVRWGTVFTICSPDEPVISETRPGLGGPSPPGPPPLSIKL